MQPTPPPSPWWMRLAALAARSWVFRLEDLRGRCHCRQSQDFQNGVDWLAGHWTGFFSFWMEESWRGKR